MAIVNITEAQMRKVLDSGKRPPIYATRGKAGELVAYWNVNFNGQPTGLVVKCYTSVAGGKVRAEGTDAIRVALVNSKTGRGVGKATATKRTPGWEGRLIAKLHDMFVEGRKRAQAVATELVKAKEVVAKAKPETCKACGGSRTYHYPNSLNETGPCYRCAGKGYQTEEDRKRNAAWDRAHGAA